MGLLFGNATFTRFQIVGGAPRRLDDNLLEKFREHRIGTGRVMRANHEEVGWIGGRHLFDRDFDLEKNVILDTVHVGMRIDASRVPPDIMRAYVQMELESLLRGGGGEEGANGNGSAVRRIARLKREAREAAQSRVAQEIKDGRYRSLRQFPLLFDSRSDVLYAGIASPAAIERLHPLFKDTFGKRLELLSAGQIAFRWAEKNGLTRRLESLTPARFTDLGNGDFRVWWTANHDDERNYLGNEFLLWLWFHLAERSDHLELEDSSAAAVVIVKQLVLECPMAESGKETIVCDGPTQLPESRRAIQTGKLPRKAGLIVSRQGQQYELTLQAETFGVSSAALPKIEPDDMPGEKGNGSNGSGDGQANGNGFGRARIEERVEQIRHLADTLDRMFECFLKRRLSDEWTHELAAMRRWLSPHAVELERQAI